MTPSFDSVPDSIFGVVEEHLETVERRHAVAVSFAVARGSHAWGGASPDSDYDVGFVFVHDDLREYAHLDGIEDAIHWEPDGNRESEDGDEFEYQGWDVSTFARLLADSNDGAIDLLRSPIRYRTPSGSGSVLEDLRAYVEATYDPVSLYHAWRGIATNNYRKYLSEHLVDGRNETYPILERRADSFVVERPGGDGTMTMPVDDERFTETQTKPTVKRNLLICRSAMYARYLTATGERGEHELPHLHFESFLEEQAGAVFAAERIDLARDLLVRKRAGEGDERVGDLVGREFAHPPREIDPRVHARGGPDVERLNGFVDELIDAALV
ncbi:DNA polymerase beta superfamily protein [Natrialbaceae archaeon GCM10025810]|uniref:nucleotidyltransferase domain-containing protein n=1 Tax=Halovalidus salilacus TaxID=3075124 RepID=UPI0036146B24